MTRWIRRLWRRWRRGFEYSRQRAYREWIETLGDPPRWWRRDRPADQEEQ